MAAVIVALLFQISWTVVRAVLEREGTALTEPHVIALSAASLAATYVTFAAASGSLAARLGGARRIGAWIAMTGAIGLVAGLAVYEALLHVAATDPHAMTTAIAVREYGWSVADALMIVGFAIAAGRRGLWFAPPAIGLALLNAQPVVTRSSWPLGVLIGLMVVKAVLLISISVVAERNAAPRTHEPDRALRGLRRIELCAWIWAAMAPIWAVAWFASPTVTIALGDACITVAVDTMFAAAAWSIVRASIPTCPRWPWYASAMFAIWALARTVRSWGFTFARHWGDLASTPLKPVDWWAAVPGLLATLCALGALAVFAHRRRARAAQLAALTALAFSVVSFAVRCALPVHTAAHVACFVVANIAAVRAYRLARPAIEGDLPRARVV